MDRLTNKRAIFDRRRVTERLLGLAETLPEARLRPAVLEALRGAVESGQAEVRRRFDAPGPEHGNGRLVLSGNSYLVDQLLRTVHDFILLRVYRNPNPTLGEHVSIVAVGGYGRAELAPYSDIDLLFLTPHKPTPHSEQVVEYLLYMLWDLGFKVGHATRTVSDCLGRARGDATIATNLLDMRYLWGDQALAQELRMRFLREVVAGSEGGFIQAKLDERDGRHDRMGGSRYVLEPNIKEGKGGLRDLQTLFWLLKYIHHTDDVDMLSDRRVLTLDEAERFENAHAFLSSLRCHMHYVSGRGEERLTFDLQTEVARRMDYPDDGGNSQVERFMKDYFLVAKDVGDLTRILCASLEAQHRREPLIRKLINVVNRKEIDGFPLDGARIAVAGPEHFEERPLDLLRIFKVAMDSDLDIHPEALQLARRSLALVDRHLIDDPAAARLFLDILSSPKNPEWGLRRMSEAGVLGRFIPDFGRVIAQMQFNMYHHYTVDEHTLMAIGILNDIEDGHRADELPIASDVIHKVLSREVLFFATFMHDIAKGLPGDHSEVGADLCEALCPRLGFSAADTQTIAWLVRYHLLMSDTAFRRDLDDPKTVQDFCRIVKSPERLRLLLVLTVADIRAVGPKTWNNWKASLLRALYWKAEEVLTGGLTAQGQGGQAVAAAKQALRERLADWPAEDVAAHLGRAVPSYWRAFEPDTLERHARMMREVEVDRRSLRVDTQVLIDQGVTEVTVLTPDHPGLLPRLSGALAARGASIVGARVYTFSNGMALDHFAVQDPSGGPIDRPDRLARLSVAIEQALAGQLDVDAEIASRSKQQSARTALFGADVRVLIDNRASLTHTVIEVNGTDRPGFLYQVTRTLAELGLQVSNAMIATYGEQAVDVFYVKDVFGLKVVNKAKLGEIRARLLERLTPDPEAMPEAVDEGTRPPRAA